MDWSYDPKTSSVTTTFTFHTTPREGDAEGTLFALYPHQWRNAGDLHFVGEYPSVRGKMKLAEGTSFRTTMRFPGVLPALPNVGGADKEKMAGLPEGRGRGENAGRSPTPMRTANGWARSPR